MRHSEPMTIRSRSSGNRVGRFLFGMVFALAGAFSIFSYFAFEISGDAWVALLLGVIFVLIGIGVAGFYSHRVLDKHGGFAQSSFGIFFSFKQTRYELSDFQQVSLHHEVRTRSSKHGSRTYDVYPLRLDGRKDLNLGEWLDFTQGRQKAEAVAKYLDLPLCDSSTGETVIRQPGDLDKSLVQRLRESGEQVERPEQPPGSAVKVSSWGGETILSLPREGFNAANLMSVVAVAVFFGFIGFQGFLDRVLDARLGVVTLVVIGVAIGLIAVGIKAFAPVKVTVDHTTLKVSRGLLFARSGEMSRSQLEEFNLDDNKLTAVSDTQRLVIPLFVSNPEDGDFVRDTILYQLSR